MIPHLERIASQLTSESSSLLLPPLVPIDARLSLRGRMSLQLPLRADVATNFTYRCVLGSRGLATRAGRAPEFQRVSVSSWNLQNSWFLIEETDFSEVCMEEFERTSARIIAVNMTNCGDKAQE